MSLLGLQGPVRVAAVSRRSKIDIRDISANRILMIIQDMIAVTRASDRSDEGQRRENMGQCSRVTALFKLIWRRLQCYTL